MSNKKLFTIRIVSLIMPVFFCAQLALGGGVDISCIRVQTPSEARGVGYDIKTDMLGYADHEIKKELQYAYNILKTIENLPASLENNRKKFISLVDECAEHLTIALFFTEFAGEIMEYVEKNGLPQPLTAEEFDKLVNINERISKIIGFYNDEDLVSALLSFPTSVSVVSVLETLSAMYTLEGKLRLTLDIEPGLPRIIISAPAIWALFSNLARNSMQALQEFYGEDSSVWPVVVVSARKETDDSGKEFVVISFSDKASGITDEALPKIFAPYFTTKSDEGTGVGLSLCKDIIERSGGAISVSSRHFSEYPDGHGTTFTVRLPIVDAVVLAAGAPAFIAQDLAPSKAGIEQDL